MTSEREARLLIADACVLIDFREAGQDVLEELARGLGRLLVASPVLAEVDGLDAGLCAEMGIEVIEPSPAQADEAATRRGGLSFADHLCLIMARDGGMTCLTNDQPLRRACADAGVPTMRALRCLLELVARRRITRGTALEAAEAMHRANPRHVTAQLLAELRRELGAT